MAIHPLPVSKIELHIKCNNLLNKDVASKSDPCAVLFLQDREKWYEHGRTENIKNNLNPKFAKSFELDYYFETVQNLRILVYDIDNKSEKLSDDDFLGSIECTLGQIVSGSPYTQPLAIKKGHQAGKGTITISATEMEGVNEVLTMTFSAKKLDNKDFLGKSDPYLEFSRQVPDGSWLLVHRTEVVKNNLNPTWRPFIIKAQKLCGGNYEKPIKVAVYDYDSDESDLIGEFTVTMLDIKTAAEQQVDCFDYDSDGSHDFIGSFTTTVLEMMEASQKQTSWECINPKKKAKKKNYTSSGIVHLTSCKITHAYSFLDFIFGGLQINFTVAFDFTASNGDPTSPQSLHYIDAYKPNEYCKAVTSVGAVIKDYDSDKMFPALGFGARIPPNMDVSHEFAINFNPQNPFCSGIDGVLNAYKMCIQKVDLYGPTNFSPIINHVGRFAAAAKAEPIAKNYFILLILTDGVITDMDATRTAIVTASELPMSIIIVGIGTADFTAMNILDGDDGVLKAPSGRTAARDIVQFVPFRDFVDGPSAVLAKHVLAEVPRQVTEYYAKAGIAPSPRRKAPAEGQPPVPAATS